MNSIEIFAGAGGLALGTARAGFQHQFVIDRNATACETLRRNGAKGSSIGHDWRVVEGSVVDYNFEQHRNDVDFVFGGPPCQPFSLGGKHLGPGDERGLFPEAVRAVREIQTI